MLAKVNQRASNKICMVRASYVMASKDGTKWVLVMNVEGEGLEPVSEKACMTQGHTGEITSLTWAPDSSYAASTSQDWTLRMWDTVHGEGPFRCSGRPYRNPLTHLSPPACEEKLAWCLPGEGHLGASMEVSFCPDSVLMSLLPLVWAV